MFICFWNWGVDICLLSRGSMGVSVGVQWAGTYVHVCKHTATTSTCFPPWVPSMLTGVCVCAHGAHVRA